jgi:homoserine kinase
VLDPVLDPVLAPADGPVTVRVPASSANLGPGFDALGIALALHDVVTVEVLDRPAGEVQIEVEGEGAAEVPRDRSHLVYRSLAHGLAAMDVPVPAVRLRCANSIPHGRGLGSSSAAIVAGLGAARALVADGRTRLPDEALFGLAATLEGHPDNVAPAVFGGLTVAYADGPADTPTYHAARPTLTDGLAFVVFVPSAPVRTSLARSLLPGTVAHRDAAFNAGRAALLVAALAGDVEHLLAATEDRLHQDSRAPAMPRSAELVRALRADGVPAVISGAGPTVLAVTDAGAAERAMSHGPAGWQVRRLEVDHDGVRASR